MRLKKLRSSSNKTKEANWRFSLREGWTSSV